MVSFVNLGVMFEGSFIFAAGVFIIYEAVHKMMVGKVSHDSTLGIAVMVPMIAMTAGTVHDLRKIAKETGSLIVKADALHYATDVYVNAGVLMDANPEEAPPRRGGASARRVCPG